MSDDPDGGIEESLEDILARSQDVMWSWFVVRRPFSWQWFLNWWIARRWVIPRDVTRR